jgi:DNA recombination protein RmuC
MTFYENLQPYLDAPLFAQLQPYLWAALGALAGFLVMAGFVARWKHRYRNLLHEHERLVDRMELEARFREGQARLLESSSEEMRLQFKALSQEIFDEKTQILTRQNSETLGHLLKPYQEQLQTFRDRIETVFLEESRDHSSLKQELLNLRIVNDRLNEEALRLSRAISGDNKQQGTWGEMVLERLLEQSGLRPGHEYVTQAGHRDVDNRLYKPDVVIHLPDDKDIVIDSKVSLSGWTKFVNAEEQAERDQAMSEHIRSLRSHLKSLNQKDYSSLKGLRTLDFVLMFIPIEGAVSTALQAEEKLLEEMYSKKVIIVTPTTLLVTLRMIEFFWQQERQNRHAVEIANRAGALYNKLHGFVTDMEKLGQQLDTCRDTYDKAVNKLSQGRGNVLSQAAKFPELGVKVKEELPARMVERAD